MFPAQEQFEKIGKHNMDAALEAAQAQLGVLQKPAVQTALDYWRSVYGLAQGNGSTGGSPKTKRRKA